MEEWWCGGKNESEKGSIAAGRLGGGGVVEWLGSDQSRQAAISRGLINLIVKLLLIQNINQNCQEVIVEGKGSGGVVVWWSGLEVISQGRRPLPTY